MNLNLAWQRTKSFFGNQQGAIAVQFGLLLVPILGLTSFGLDLARAFTARAHLQNAADAAAIAMTSYALQQFKAGTVASTASINTVGSNIFSANISNYQFDQNPGSTFSNSTSGINITATVTFTATSNSIFQGLLYAGALTYSGSSVSQTSTNPYIDVYLLIDQSGSMSIGSTTNDINALIAGTNCAFACHDSNNVYSANGHMVDAYNWAVAKNVTLKFQVVNQGITNFVQYIQSIDPSAQRIRVALYSFDNNVYTLVPLTSSTGQILSNLPSAPAAASETTAATLFNENVAVLTNAVGSSGDGSTQANSKKIFILASDGVEDPGRFWTYETQYMPDVAPFNMSFCTTMHRNGVSVGILNTGYLPMTWDWGYNDTIGAASELGHAGTRRDDIAPLMQSCAGSLYIDGSSGTNIPTAFQNIFISATSPRITQ